jgi:hypothetical protein
MYIIETIPVIGRRGLNSCDTSTIRHFVDSRLTNGGEIVSRTRRPPFTTRKLPGTQFCWRLSKPRGHSAVGRVS